MRDGLVRREAHERVERRLEAEEHADATRAHLASHVEAARGRLLDPREDATPLIGRVIALHRRDRHRPSAGRATHLLEEIELRIEALGPLHHVEVAHRLDDAVAKALERGRDPRELAAGGLGRGRRSAARRAVVVASSRREARRARLERRAEERAHRGDVVVGRLLLGHGALAHHVDAQRIVRDLQEEIDRVRHAPDRVHVLRERLPAPRDALGERGAGDVLDAFHELDELFLAPGDDRSEPDAAAPHHARGDAVERARRELLVPRDLAVVVGVDVHEPREHVRAARVERATSRAVALADRDDAPVLDGDVARERRAARAVDDGPAHDFQVEHLRMSFTL